MSSFRKICLKAEPDNTKFFGFSVAINNKYLAIGDPGANHIVLYKPNQSGRWVRTSKIFPPLDSLSHKVGSGFGLNLQLDGDTLVTSAKTLKKQTYYVNPLNLYLRRYLIKLTKRNRIIPIPPIMQKKDGIFEFHLLSQGQIKQVIFSDNGEEQFGYFGNGVDIYNNLLLIGSPSKSNKSRAWLIDINKPEIRPALLEDSNSIFGESVSVSKKFAIVNHNRIWQPDPHKINNSIRPRTLIRSINNCLTKIINNYGEVSLSRNIMALFLPNTPGRFNSSLRLFQLDDNAVPHLIEKRRYLKRAWVQNGFLINVEEDRRTGIHSVSIESIN